DDARSARAPGHTGSGRHAEAANVGAAHARRRGCPRAIACRRGTDRVTRGPANEATTTIAGSSDRCAARRGPPAERAMISTRSSLELTALSKSFPTPGGPLVAVHDLNFSVE